MIVRAMNTLELHPMLIAGKEYVVLGIDDEFYRVLAETGDPALFPKDTFEIVDDTIPSDWVWSFGSSPESVAG